MQSTRIVRVGGTEADYRAFEMLLRGAGISGLRFASRAEAIDLLATRAVDLLLLDASHPGNEVFQLLYAAAPGNRADGHIPTIVTGPAAAADRLQMCLQRGAEDFVFTPLDAAHPTMVVRRIELALQRARLRDFADRTSATANDVDATGVLQLYPDASSRFVPREFLDILGRKTLADVKLGDHVEREMTVLFSDIRDFTTLSERLTPKQNFDFLNSYLKQVTPVIRARSGFIDKYIGDAIMALFPGSAGDALQSAVQLQRQLERYNVGRRLAGYTPIRVGTGLHRGELILGTVGEEERLQTTVISDAVNVASRIQGLTKAFGVPLLVSGSVVEGLDDGHGFRLRHLGAVKARGKRQSVEIYECYDTDIEDLLRHKDVTAHPFASAMGEFRKGMFLTAGRVFARIAEQHPGDTVAAHYRDSCTLSAVRERGRGPWDGAETIEVH